jgi:hypothetical protein
LEYLLGIAEPAEVLGLAAAVGGDLPPGGSLAACLMG